MKPIVVNVRIPRSRWSFRFVTTPSSRYSLLDTRKYQFRGVLDDGCDERDADDPAAVSNYVEEMYAFYRQQESCVGAGYMNSYPYFSSRMRGVLVDWLLQIHCFFDCLPPTLYMAVSLLDRFLAKDGAGIARGKLQLVGVTCLLIATKFEETHPIPLGDLIYACRNIYREHHVSAMDGILCNQSDAIASCVSTQFNFACSCLIQIVDMEGRILRALDYSIFAPTASTFLLRFLKAGHADKDLQRASFFILDSAILSSYLLRYLPSQLAAACVFLARRKSRRNSWSPTLLKYTLYCEEEVLPVAHAIECEQPIYLQELELQGVVKKYSWRAADQQEAPRPVLAPPHPREGVDIVLCGDFDLRGVYSGYTQSAACVDIVPDSSTLGEF